MAKAVGAARTSARRVVRIRAICVSGYKSLIKPTTIELAPLTILAGPNSSGKSSAIQPILLLKQTLEAPYDPGPLLLYGPNVRFTSADQFLSRLGGRSSAREVRIEFETAMRSRIALVFIQHPQRGLDLDHVMYQPRQGTSESRIHLKMTQDEIANVVPKELRDILSESAKVPRSRLTWKVMRDRCFLPFGAFLGEEPESMVRLGGTSYYGEIEHFLNHLIHVPPIRGNPERTYRVTAVGDRYPGTFEPYVASIINRWKSTSSPRLRELGSALERLGLTWKVEPRQKDATQVELRVGRLPHGMRGGAHDMVNIADVGFGISQVIPVIVALLAAKPGQAIYIEEPEIHLHPLAQSRMADLVFDAVRGGVRVILETHSTLLLRRVQTVVARGEISPQDVRLYWFTRSEAGETLVSRAQLAEDGSFGEWPADFDEVALGVEGDYLDAVARRRLGA
ncbi:MAG: AAA family ATPase [Chloroflexi bacterium]|nr:AAA family ATPase [Chloroflexota bacterium]